MRQSGSMTIVWFDPDEGKFEPYSAGSCWKRDMRFFFWEDAQYLLAVACNRTRWPFDDYSHGRLLEAAIDSGELPKELTVELVTGAGSATRGKIHWGRLKGLLISETPATLYRRIAEPLGLE